MYTEIRFQTFIYTSKKWYAPIARTYGRIGYIIVEKRAWYVPIITREGGHEKYLRMNEGFTSRDLRADNKADADVLNEQEIEDITGEVCDIPIVGQSRVYVMAPKITTNLDKSQQMKEKKNKKTSILQSIRKFFGSRILLGQTKGKSRQ